MEITEVVNSSLGRTSLTFESQKDSGPLRIYINEFLGSVRPPQELQGMVDGFVTLPGYDGMPLAPDLTENSLNWEAYGEAVATLLVEMLEQPVGLLGNSMGSMVAIYAALKQKSIIDHLVLYRVPTFGGLRGQVHSKYGHVADSITDENAFEDFLSRIESKVDVAIIRTLEAAGWEGAKKLYSGAAVSDLDLSRLKNITVPVYFLSDEKEVDDVHPAIAQEKLFTLITGSSIKEVIQLENIQNGDLSGLIEC